MFAGAGCGVLLLCLHRYLFFGDPLIVSCVAGVMCNLVKLHINMAKVEDFRKIKQVDHDRAHLIINRRDE